MSRRAWGAEEIARRLGLPQRMDHALAVCPFHPDTKPSLSVDLTRGVWFCHGGCADPRGGGVIDFLIKWALVKEGKTLTPREAKKILTRAFAFPDNKTLVREMAREEIERFARQMLQVFADLERETQRTIDRIDRSLGGVPPALTDWRWDALAALYGMRSKYGYAFEVCMLSQRQLNASIADVYRWATRCGLWKPRSRTPLPRQPVGEPCREPQSETTPLPSLKTPLTSPKRQARHPIH